MNHLEKKIQALILSESVENQQLGWTLDKSQNKDQLRKKLEKEYRWFLNYINCSVEALMTSKSLFCSRPTKYLTIPRLPLLKSISCDHIRLWELHLKNCQKVTSISCIDNHLLDLNINDCEDLEDLNCYYNPLKKLDASHCAKLKTLDCHGCNIEVLNLKNCTMLKKINCKSNKLSVLDLRDCSSLETLEVDDAVEIIK